LPHSTARKTNKVPLLPFNGCSKKNRCFISLCLRSVHSLHSFRFRGQRSFLTAVHLSLHCIQFISPTSAPHSLGKYSFPFRKLHSFRFPQAPFQRISNGLFFILRRVHPNKRLSGRAVSLLHLNGELIRRTANIRNHRRPHHPLVVQKINIYRVDYPCACSICVPFRLHSVLGFLFVPHRETRHFILPTLQAFTSAPHSFGKYSFPFRKLIHSVFPKPFSNAFPAVYIYFCDELAPKNKEPQYFPTAL
jgi:hypothetical protein